MALFSAALAAHGEDRLLSVGGHRLWLDCSGDRSSQQTVILIAGQGRTAQDWATVQPAVAQFSRVCSYDRAGLGRSDKTANPQSLDDIADDLHRLLNMAKEKTPYLLVGHSIGGIICRRFTAAFPREVSGLLFLDSSHEEQIWRLHEIDPKGPVPGGSGPFLATGQRLDWHTSVPLIVIAAGKAGPPIPQLTNEQNAAFTRVWRELQEDLARRSPKGQFRVTERSGHFIQTDEPEAVVQAIRDLVQLARR